MTIEEYENTFRSKKSLQYMYFQVLKDQEWHCRKCDAADIDSGQLAGGGGIQGLQRGTQSRPGISIGSENRLCPKCNSIQRCDRWDGSFKNANSASGLPASLQEKIRNHYHNEDVIEQRPRQKHELVIDHRFPMERWGTAEDSNSPDMTDEEIEEKFQLLKKDDSGNHNLLKSRACERCIATGKREGPLGIMFFYEGDENWPEDCPSKGEEAKRGCIGCGWYNFQAWRDALNEKLSSEDGEN